MISETVSSAFTMGETALKMARLLATCRSKDPRTKVGACVLCIPTGQMAFGYNGFPRGIPDRRDWWEDREIKHTIVNHAEQNAIQMAYQVFGTDLSDCALYVTHWPCRHCMKDFIIPSRIRQVFVSALAPKESLDPVSMTLADRALVSVGAVDE